jgi:hypothetical protein
MAIKPLLVRLSVVPDAQTQKEIENTIDAPEKLAKAIETFKHNRADAYRSSPPKQNEDRVRRNLRLFGNAPAQERYAK